MNEKILFHNKALYSWTICKVEKFFCWPLTIGNWGNFSFHAVSCLNPMSVLDSVSANFPDIIFWAFHRWPAALPWTKRRFPEAFNTQHSWDQFLCRKNIFVHWFHRTMFFIVKDSLWKKDKRLIRCRGGTNRGCRAAKLQSTETVAQFFSHDKDSKECKW